MNAVARNTIFICLGFLIALIVLFGLSSMFKPKGSQRQFFTSNASGAPIASGQEATASAQIASDAVQLAKKEVVTLTKLPEKTIDVVQQQRVDWPDSSLGCPQPGFAYLQVITPGYKIILQTPEEIFEYHTDMGSTILLCRTQKREQP